ncbi:MAG: hypothetical protein ACR2LN_01055 [Candidatus Levyibacteriota bacterium]
MNQKIVLGVIASSSAETAINNLTEADFDEKNISLVMKDEQSARKIIDAYGPLKDTSVSTLPQALQRLGMQKAQSDHIIQAVVAGKALIAIQTPQEAVDAAKEMLNDYNVTLMTVL